LSTRRAAVRAQPVTFVALQASSHTVADSVVENPVLQSFAVVTESLKLHFQFSLSVFTSKDSIEMDSYELARMPRDREDATALTSQDTRQPYVRRRSQIIVFFLFAVSVFQTTCILRDTLCF
jgi:hypothetical protein